MQEAALNNVIEICKSILYEKYNPFQWGDCNEINCTMCSVLIELGHYNAKALTGYVLLDVPLDPEDDVEGNGVFDPCHCWVLLGSQVIDLASQQFDGHIETEIEYLSGTEINHNEFCDKVLRDQILSEIEKTRKS